MNVELREMINFHLTGRRSAVSQNELAGLVPAVLAPYRNLAGIRYDYPLVLLQGPDTEAFVDTLSGIINRMLRDIAPQGRKGALLRQHVLMLETRMRELASDSLGIPLDELWQRAEKSLLAECESDETEQLQNSIATARFALRVRGDVVDCDAQLPARLLTHAWREFYAGRSDYAKRINKLIIGLEDLLKVDELKYGPSRTPHKLKAAVGKRHSGLFDFDRLSELLDDMSPRNCLPVARKRRVAEALEVLRSQRFFALTEAHDVYDFVFDSLATALKAYSRRLPEMTDLVRAVAIAELELGNAYVEDKHDSYFERFGAQALSVEDMMQFPSYLVCLHESECNTRDLARLIEIVNGDMAIKVLIHVSEPLGEPSPVGSHAHRGSFAQQLASTFVAGNAFVMQAPASNLYKQRDDIVKGLAYKGPAIFSVFVPFHDGGLEVPPYLAAAATLESRVFPAFSYDPSSGKGLADRFDISHNPDVEADWPQRKFSYEDSELQSVYEESAFTAADFALMLPQYGEHFATAVNESWFKEVVPVADYIDKSESPEIDKVPGIAAVDANDTLHRLVVDDKLMRIVRRCRDRWRALQELGNVHSSYAVAVSEPVPAEEAEAAMPVSAEEAPPASEAAEVADAAIDEPYIETPRCTTCDECTKRNDRMFSYDENKQAYIADPDAGTYRDLVEAAEMCQVAIIHPGRPRNPDEPGLEELAKRAEPFNA